MRKRIVLPIFTLLIFFPLLVFVISYTRFFNDEVGNLAVNIFDQQTNARLFLGKIHGSILGSFWIDGVALMYHDKPIALIDTVKVKYLPLSLIAKTAEVLRADFVNPRFYLIRYKDGTFNVDHIGKPTAKVRGNFDWLVILKNVVIHGGEFSYFDSISAAFNNERADLHKFDPSDFRLLNIDVAASGNISSDNLTANVENISCEFEPAEVKVNSLKFGFFASPAGTEVSGLHLNSKLADLECDLTLTGQSILDPISLPELCRKPVTANITANKIDLSEFEKFIDLPIKPGSDVRIESFISGNLDSLYVRQLAIGTDSSFLPLTASLYNVIDSTFTMRVATEGSVISPRELSAMLEPVGLPDLGRFNTILLNAKVEGRPSSLRISLKVNSGEARIAGGADCESGLLDGNLQFHDLHIGELFNTGGVNGTFNGSAEFSALDFGSKIPQGHLNIQIDTSSFERAYVQSGLITVASLSDSLKLSLDLSTTRGNLNCSAFFDHSSGNYGSSVAFSGLDLSSYLRIPSLEGVSTGELTLAGTGFDVDSMNGILTVKMDSSTLGGVPFVNSVLTLDAHTTGKNRSVQLKSPFLDASISGNYVPDKLPSQISDLVTVLADSFGSKLTGFKTNGQIVIPALSDIDADIKIDIKNAGFVGHLAGIPEVYGNPRAQLKFQAGKTGLSLGGSLDADSIGYRGDSAKIIASQLKTHFSVATDSGLSIWTKGKWSADANFNSLDVNGTHIASKLLKAEYYSSGYSHNDSMSITAMAQVDSVADFYIDAAGTVGKDSIVLTSNTLLGKLFGYSLTQLSAAHITYYPEAFTLLPITFSETYGTPGDGKNSTVSAEGSYSLKKGADMRFTFDRVSLVSLQQLGKIDSNSLKLRGSLSGDAKLQDTPGGTTVAINFRGSDVDYNGSQAKLVDGNVKVLGDHLELLAQLSKPSDSSWYALKVAGTIPFSEISSTPMALKVTADSLNISFLTPLLSGVEYLGGVVTGSMTVAGKYSLPAFEGRLNVKDGDIRLAANQIPYPFSGIIEGQGDKLVLTPVTLRNLSGQQGTTMKANGSMEIRNNTIVAFDINLDGTLPVLNSTAKSSNQGMYGTAVAGSGGDGLKLEGSLSRPFLVGSGIIQSTTLTLLPIQAKRTTAVEDVVYRFPVDASQQISPQNTQPGESTEKQVAKGSFIDSLRYDVNVETKDNVNLRMIFDPTTNEELDAILGGRLHLANNSGSMELTGDVNILTGSTYNFYGKQFASTGKLRFSGDPLNPFLDITGIYQGQHSDTSATGKPQNVVVQLKITGTFNQPSVDISLTVDNIPYPRDQQTNAVSFILTGQFEDELTSVQKQNVANNLWSQTGAGVLGSVGSSMLSGYLTNLLGKQFEFIQSVGLQYDPNSSFTDPSVQITSRIGKGTIRVQTPIVTTDIASTGFSFNYPLTLLLNNMIYLEASRDVAINNRTLGQRETTDMLRLFYQISF